MGSSSSMYEDGDLPRLRYVSAKGPGRAHYKARLAGRCVTCNKPTNYWLVSSAVFGAYKCVACEENANSPRRQKNTGSQNVD